MTRKAEPDPRELRELTEKFRRAGAPNPEGWARSQLREGINQLHRFLYLRQAWDCIIREENDPWIDREIEQARNNPSGPYAGIGLALERLLEGGATRDDLTDVVRGMQASLLFSLCYRLDDPSFEEEEFSNIGWALVEADNEGGSVGQPISGLYESVLETDPERRELRPRNVTSR